MRTPLIDALDNLCSEAGKCGIDARSVVLASADVYARLEVELGYCTRMFLRGTTPAGVDETRCVLTVTDGAAAGLRILGPMC